MTVLKQLIKNPWTFSKSLVYKVKSNLIIDKHTKRFINHNKKVWQDWCNINSESVILFDFFRIHETIISFSYFLNVLAKKHNARILYYSMPRKNPYLDWQKVYRSFNTSGHIVISLNNEQERRKKIICQEVLPGLRTKQDIFDLKIAGIWVGIDIYETYLSRYRKPTVFLDDPKLFELVEEGISDVIFWQDYFSNNKVAAIVASQSAYIPIHVVCKVAYQQHVPVYIPTARGIKLVNKPLANDAYFKDYRSMFSILSHEEQREGIALAKKQLERKFSGEVGVNMPYTTHSAFHSTREDKRVLRLSKNIKVLICSHCFYDNPHAYGEILFLDFYEWLRYLGNISKQTDYDWYLKVHPDPLPGTIETIKEILSEFPRITLIPHNTSHHQLVNEGIDFVLTVYGTVGEEYPALGVQVINASYNPRAAYDFNWHPKSREEYEYYLLNLDKLNKEICLDELYEFYYLHHYYAIVDDLIFNSWKQFLKDLHPEHRNSPFVYEYFLNQLTETKHQQIVNNIKNFLDSGKPYYLSRGPE